MSAVTKGPGAWEPSARTSYTDDEILAIVAWLKALSAMPRWRRWLWGNLPPHRLTYWLIDRLSPSTGNEASS